MKHAKKAPGKKARHKKSGSRKGRKRRGGLGAVSKDALKNAAKGIVNPLAIILGYTASAFAGRMLDKIEAIKPDAAKEGFQFKSLIKPIVLLGAGITISAVSGSMGKKAGAGKDGMHVFIKNFGYGFIVGGAVSFVKSVIKKDLFEGFGGAPAIDAKYLQESKDLLKQLIEENSRGVELPEPNGGSQMELPGPGNDFSGGIGDAVLPFATLRYEDMSTII